MPTSRAQKICPSLIVLPGDRGKYESFSRRLFAILESYTPVVEQGSIDEGYGDFSGMTMCDPSEAAMRLREEIRSILGLPVSIGLATNKLLASVASKLRKPDHFLEVPPGQEREFLAPLPVRWLPGVGPKVESMLHSSRLRTIADVSSSTVESLAAVVGSSAPRLIAFSLGVDNSAVRQSPPSSRSYSRQETFPRDSSSVDLALRTLRVMSDDLMNRVRSERKMVQCVEVRLRYPGMSEIRRSETLSAPTDLETDVYHAVDNLIARMWKGGSIVRLVALRLSRVTSRSSTEQSDLLLPGFDTTRRRDLARAMDKVNSRYGVGAIVRAHQI